MIDVSAAEDLLEVFRNLKGSAQDTRTQAQVDGSRSPAAEMPIKLSTPYFYPNDGKCPKLCILL